MLLAGSSFSVTGVMVCEIVTCFECLPSCASGCRDSIFILFSFQKIKLLTSFKDLSTFMRNLRVRVKYVRQISPPSTIVLRVRQMDRCLTTGSSLFTHTYFQQLSPSEFFLCFDLETVEI